MRVVAIALAVAGLLLVSLWVINLRRENIRLESTVEVLDKPPTPISTGDSAVQARPQTQPESQPQPQLQPELARLRRRLDQLRVMLDEVVRMGRQPPTGSVRGHLDELRDRRARLQTEVNELIREQQEMLANAQGFRQAQRGQTVDSRLTLQQQIQNVNNQLLALQNQPVSPQRDAEEQRLRLTRDQLETSVRSLGSIEQRAMLDVSAQLRAEIAELEAEQIALQAELADVNAELEFWEEQQTGRRPTAEQPERVQQLRNQIDNLDQELRRRSQ